ncbi:MAG: hypothetical protein E6J41_16725 [Chloroflexi bacterium]|nr:MAG: hypothetical protein E6J41_16725 [Chloroflexota bacterium]
MRIGILTGGGDAPGLNAAIRAVVRVAHRAGHSTSGIENGWAGALEGRMDELLPRDVRGILPLGGTILGTSRTNPLKEPDGLQRAIVQLRSHGVDAVVAMGGDDTLSVAAALHEAGCPVVGVPKTIDNDLSATDFCIGFDTAVGIVAEALDRLHTTASAHHRVMVVEVMGRDVGWVAALLPDPRCRGEGVPRPHRGRVEGLGGRGERAPRPLIGPRPGPAVSPGGSSRRRLPPTERPAGAGPPSSAVRSWPGRRWPCRRQRNGTDGRTGETALAGALLGHR